MAKTESKVYRLPPTLCSAIKDISTQTELAESVVVRTAVHMFVTGEEDISKAYRDYVLVKNIGKPMKRLALIRLRDAVEAGVYALRHGGRK